MVMASYFRLGRGYTWWTWRNPTNERSQWPIPSMYGIFTYIWVVFMVNVGKYIKYARHGSYGVYHVRVFEWNYKISVSWEKTTKKKRKKTLGRYCCSFRNPANHPSFMQKISHIMGISWGYLRYNLLYQKKVNDSGLSEAFNPGQS